jgi:hypothetical protein
MPNVLPAAPVTTPQVSVDGKFARYRESPKGQAAAARRNARVKAARAARKAYHYTRKNQARTLGFDGRYGGPVPAGVPRLSDLKLSNFMIQNQGRKEKHDHRRTNEIEKKIAGMWAN